MARSFIYNEQRFHVVDFFECIIPSCMTNEGLGGQATENNTAINNLSESQNVELRYEQLVENMPAAVYTCDAQGYITSYNKAAAELWGRKPVLGKDLWCGSWKIFWPDGSPVSLDECPMAITLKTGVAVTNREIVIERPDGMRVNVRPHPSPIFDAAGNIAGAVNILVDITESKLADEKTPAWLQSFNRRMMLSSAKH